MSWSAHATEDDKKEFFDSPDVLQSKARKVANLFRNSKHAIVFTGAGISTSVGVADFRSGLNTKSPGGPGLWERQADYERKTNGARNAFTKNDPTRPKVDLDAMIGKEPSFTHRAIAKLVELGMVKAVLSQNVDNLHRKSGLRDRTQLAELHGNLMVETCPNCGAVYERPFRVGPNMGKNHMTGRNCDKCGHVLRDNLVPFGEGLPKEETDKAWKHSDGADFCLAIGTSLTVTPACDYAAWVGQKSKPQYVEWTKNHTPEKGDLVIVNLQRTPHDGLASEIMHGFCDDAMKRVMEELGVECH
ncbi:unnamed protein product [Amoebophrya sp. A25]|nr:unnamed protein product [Amoebophrya sp. A25]|eukprot:GSA25T00019765001.1